MSGQGFRLRRRGESLLRHRFFGAKNGPMGFAEFAGWLARGWLWLDGWFTASAPGPIRVSIELGGHAYEVEALRFRFSREDLSELPAAGQILVLPCAEAAGQPATIDALHLEIDGSWFAWTGAAGMPIRPDLAFRLPEKVGPFSPETEWAFRRFWLGLRVPAVASDGDADPTFELNDATVERLVPSTPEELEALEAAAAEQAAEEEEEEPPSYVAEPDQPLGLSLEQVVAIDDRRVFLRGWWWDAEGVVEGLDLISPGGARQPLWDALIETRRADVVELYRPSYGDRADGARGFFALVDLAQPAEAHRGYRLELVLATGEPLQVGQRPPTREPFAGREIVLASLPEEPANLGVLRDHVAPALEPLEAECRRVTGVAGSFTFGTPPSSPWVSLLVPLFRRLDLIEHQLAQLAADPAIHRCELIYVLDSPELAPELEETAFHLSQLFTLPIRGLVMARNVGPAGALNAAAAVADGRRLVLWHSDVFPDRPGWLERMAELADSSAEIGIVGAKLLYEDRALQHAGHYFSRDRRPDGLWSAEPRFKGLPELFPRADVARRVPAVSGACLMIDRSLFERVGGFRDDYVAGDLEDADLCLRCLEEGFESWYQPAAALYHVEGMSHLSGPGWRRNAWTELYNRYRFDRRWKDRLEGLMAGWMDQAGGV